MDRVGNLTERIELTVSNTRPRSSGYRARYWCSECNETYPNYSSVQKSGDLNRARRPQKSSQREPSQRHEYLHHHSLKKGLRKICERTHSPTAIHVKGL